MPVNKIATCCYCGTRAALVLRGRERQELSCSKCGAPLHNLKMLPIQSARRAAPVTTSPRTKPKAVHPKQPHPRPRKVKKYKKSRGLWGKIVEEIWDEIEDIFD